ncbi:hypothetical protein ACFL2Q_11000 [Thermodesulfobacteriota bacterium]
MSGKGVAVVAALMCLIPICAVTNLAAQSQQGAAAGKGLIALDRAARAQRYLFVFFYKNDDQQTRALGGVFNKATSRVADRADPVAVMTTNPAERGIVTKFGVDRAPMPLVLVLAPNGAITGSFNTSFTEDQLVGALVGPAEAKVLKSLQQGRLVLVCAQNDRTRFNVEAMRGVSEFKADQRYSGATDVVVVDPVRTDSRPFLTKLGARFPMNQAATFFLAPPGSLIGQFQGPINKNQLVATVTSAVSGCGTSCKPGSCSVK